MRTLRWLLVPAVVLPLGWLFFTGFSIDPRAVASPLIGRPAPEWTATSLDGQTLSSDELAGRPYVVNFWAAWCDPCVGEHPILAGTQQAFGDELGMVGILYNDSPENAQAFLDRYGPTGYPTAIDETGALAVDFGVTGPPETFFVDADGIVRYKQWGPLTEAAMTTGLASIGVAE